MTAAAVQPDAGEATALDRLWAAVLTDRGQRSTLGAVLIIEVILFSSVARNFLTANNLLNAGQATAVLMVVSVGATFGLISGALDISVGSTIALSGTVGTKVMATGIHPILAIAIVIGVGIAVGLVNGFVVVKLRVNPIVATLGMLGIARGIAYVLDGGSGVLGNLGTLVTDPIYTVMQREIFEVQVSLIFAAVFAAAGWLLLSRTRFGLYAYAVGGNSESGRSAALPVDRLRIMYLVVSGTCSGAAGFVLSSSQGGSAASAAFGWELIIITAVILGGVGLTGGTGSMGGTVLGVVILGLLINGMTLAGWQTFYQLIAQGGLLLFAVGLDAARTGGYR